MHAVYAASCHVGEGLLPELSVVVKEAEERRQLKLTHAWQLQTVTHKGRLITHSSCVC